MAVFRLHTYMESAPSSPSTFMSLFNHLPDAPSALPLQLGNHLYQGEVTFADSEEMMRGWKGEEFSSVAAEEELQ